MSKEQGNLPAPRLPLQMSVQYRKSYARNETSGTLKNISLTGAFLQTIDLEEFSPEDKLTITFNVSGRERDLQATVIWNSKTGYGIKFHPFNNRDIQIVDDLMYFVENTRKKRRKILDTIFTKVS